MNSKQALDRIMKILNLTPQKFYEAKTEQGIAVKIDGDLEVGAPIYVATEEGMIPAPPGIHKLDDGSEIEVDEEGKVAKIKMGDMPESEDEEEETEEEDMKKKEMDGFAVELEFGDVELKDGTIIRVEGEEPSAGLMVKKVGYDGTLSAINDGEYVTKGGKVISIVGGSIQGVQTTKENDERKTGSAANAEDPLADIGKATANVFAVAKSADGVEIESPTFDVGEDAMVVKEDGTKEPAPDGEHQVVLKDSEGNDVKIRIMTKDGKITERENVEEGMMSVEDIAQLFSQALQKIESKIDSVAAKQTELEGKFLKFSKEPAGQKVFTQKTINETFSQTEDRLEQFKRLRAALNRN